jgi:uncharacterized coiled-coil DUF342 family protein
MADVLAIAHDLIRSYGGYLGSGSAAVAGYIFKRFRATETAALSASKLAKELRDQFEDFKEKFDELRTGFDTFRQVTERTSHSRIESDDVHRRFNELGDRLDEIRSSVLGERGARHALQKEFYEYVKGEAEQWKELHRSLGKIEGRLEKVLSKE